MATAPANDISDPVVAGEIIIVDPRQVEMGDRLRRIDRVWAESIGRSMERDGQITPIDVCPDPATGTWRLAGPGAHRLTGALIREHEGIEARIVSADNDTQLRREAAENLFRRSNDPLERAAAIAELVRIHKVRAGVDPTKDGRAASATARWQKAVKAEAADASDTMSLVYGWSDEVAELLGVSKRTVERDLLLYRRLAPSLVARLREARHPVATNAGQLRALAKLDDDEQRRAVDQLLRHTNELSQFHGAKPLKSVAEALAVGQLQSAAPDPEAKRLSTFLSTFQRMGLAEKKGALAHLAGMLPAGIQLISSDQSIDEAVGDAIDSARAAIDGLIEDEIVTGDRLADLERVSGDLARAQALAGTE